MKFSFTDGKEIMVPDMCGFCLMGTGGQHELNCLLNKADEIIVNTRVRYFSDVHPKDAE
jgi:hypothetical protein